MTEEEQTLSIEQIASQPKKVEIDGRVVEQHSISDLIELDRYASSKKAIAKGRTGLIFSRFRAGGAV